METKVKPIEDGHVEQGELFQAQTTWFHVFKAMIDSGDAARIGPHALALYVVIKSYTNFSTGHAFPRLELLVEKSGMSLAQVKRSIQKLVEFGYITKEKQGRRNVYRLREKIGITDEYGRPAAVATWDYLPSTVEAARAELRNFLMKGRDGEPLQYIHIERLNLTIENLQTGSNNTQINLRDIKDPELRKQISELLNKSQRVS
jgi:DNA-binding transcriptional MocR family regulator